MDAFVCTCNDIVRMRAGQKECDACETFMESLDMEICLQMSMLADATDEALGFIRFLDDEQFDTSQLFSEIQSFTERISCLFLRAQCVNSGFTKHMMTWLQTSVQLKLRKKLLSLGSNDGVPAEVVARCLLRMQHWVILATETVQAEFPCWESFQSFSLFDLNGVDDIRSCQMVDERSRICANVGHVASSDFITQLADHRPGAVRIFKESRCSSREAWRQAVQRSQRKGTRLRHPCDALCAVAMRFVCWSASTSGVESTFSRQKRALGDLGFGRDESYLNDQLQIMESYGCANDDEKTIRLAIAEWCDVYGSARASGAANRMPHMHKGLPGTKKEYGMKNVHA